MKNRYKSGTSSRAALFCLLAATIIFLSCKTTPQTPDPFVTPAAGVPLESGALVYALVDVNGGRPIVDLIPIQGVSPKQAGLVLDKTDSIAAALYGPASERRFQLAAWGDFTPSQGGLIFGMNKDWKKMRCPSKHPYWYSKSNRMSVAMGKRQAFVTRLNGAAPAHPCTHSAGTEMPAGFREFTRGSVMSCWIDNPGTTVNEFIEKLGIPLSVPAVSFFISLFPNDEKSGMADSMNTYEASVRIETSNATQARALVRIITMARFLTNGFSVGGVLQPVIQFILSNDPVQDENTIRMKTEPVSTREMALLIETILLYSRTGNP
jgi:hypothetical protein